MSEQELTNATQYGFIPSPLLIEDRPELAVFPLNVMFVSLANIDGVDTSGTALYEPNILSYVVEAKVRSMRYYNKYSEEDYIDIKHYINADRYEYEGDKYVKNSHVLSAYGASWKGFFIHLTIKGLSKDEGCMFSKL